MYAIAHGADTIYDTDDDNDLIDPTSAADLPTVPPRVTRSVAVNRQCAVPIVNMLSLFGASEENTWPRGYPLELIREQDSLCGAVDANDADDGEVDDVWLWQSLANYDPDVDAVYRYVVVGGRGLGLGLGRRCVVLAARSPALPSTHPAPSPNPPGSPARSRSPSLPPPPTTLKRAGGSASAQERSHRTTPRAPST